MGTEWWRDPLPYQVIGPGGDVLFQTMLDLRYPPRIERTMLEQGCTILVGGRKLTRKELAQRGQENKMQGMSLPGS